MFRKTILKSGLRILTYPMESTEAVTILVLVATGSKYETKNINGISHFLEHLFFKGTKKYPNTLKLSEAMDKIGGAYNAFTTKEYTGYWAKVDSKHFDFALSWLAEILLRSKFESKEIEKEKKVIIEEINMYQDIPSHYVSILFENLLYGDQPAGWPTAGEKETISSLKRENFLKYLKINYSAKNSLICVVGKFNEGKVKDRIESAFKKILRQKSPKKLKTIEKQTKPEVLSHFKETDQTHLILGTRAYNMFSEKRYPLAVLANILGGIMSSRLFIKVREKGGLSYYISTHPVFYTDSGYLETSAGVHNEKVEEAIRIILKEYQKVREKRVGIQELKKAKDNLKGHLLLSLETSDAWAGYFGLQEIHGQKILTPQQECDKIEKVKASDILNIAREIFQPKKLNLALIGPFKEKKRFEKILHEF